MGTGKAAVYVFAVALCQLNDSVAVELSASFLASALVLTLHQRSHWHVKQILYCLKKQVHANVGGDAYETPRRGPIKGATKAKSECIRFPITLTLMVRKCIKGASA